MKLASNSTPRRLHKGTKFEANLDYMVRPWLKNKTEIEISPLLGEECGLA